MLESLPGFVSGRTQSRRCTACASPDTRRRPAQPRPAGGRRRRRDRRGPACRNDHQEGAVPAADRHCRAGLARGGGGAPSARCVPPDRVHPAGRGNQPRRRRAGDPAQRGAADNRRSGAVVALRPSCTNARSQLQTVAHRSRDNGDVYYELHRAAVVDGNPRSRDRARRHPVLAHDLEVLSDLRGLPLVGTHDQARPRLPMAVAGFCGDRGVAGDDAVVRGGRGGSRSHHLLRALRQRRRGDRERPRGRHAGPADRGGGPADLQYRRRGRPDRRRDRGTARFCA